MPIDLVCDSKEGLWTVRVATSFLVYDRLVLPVSVAMIQKSTGKVGTTTCADFCEHDSGYLGRPAFQPKMLTHGTQHRTPRKERELSLPKLSIYLRSVFRFGFLLACTLA